DAGITPTTTVVSVNGVTGGSSSTITVTTVAGGTLVVDKATGAYTYTLNGVTTDDVNDTPTFNYVLRDSANGQTTNANLVINVVDDAPIGSDVTETLQAASAALTFNLVIILDSSGSMAQDANGRWSNDAGFDPATVRMNIAKDALAQLLERYDGLGNVNVKIIDFASGANESTWFIDDKTNAVTYINNIDAGGGTEYRAALNETMSGFTQPPADKTLFYFISDGVPSDGGITNSSTPSITSWQNFVAANADISFGIGIGSASLTSLTPIAYPNTDVDGNPGEDYAIVVANAQDLANTLLATVDGGVV